MSDSNSTTQDTQSLVERLFNAGAHFGFTKSRRHPTVKPYLYGTKDGSDIIDLEQSSALLTDAQGVLFEAGKAGKKVLFVSTKEECAVLVQKAAESISMPYVVNRWIGGMLTNFTEIKKRINRLATLREEGESGELERKYTKKERVVIGRELTKLDMNFGGMAMLDRIPSMMVIVDPRHDSIALQEATDANIPTIAIMSSDCDASKVTHPVIMNDALQSSVDLALQSLTEGYAAGAKEYQEEKPAKKYVKRDA